MNGVETRDVALSLAAGAHASRAAELAHELNTELTDARGLATTLARVLATAARMNLDAYLVRALGNDAKCVRRIEDLLDRHLGTDVAIDYGIAVDLAEALADAHTQANGLVNHLSQPRVAVLTYSLMRERDGHRTAAGTAYSLTCRLADAGRLARRLARHHAWRLAGTEMTPSSAGARAVTIDGEGGYAVGQAGPGFPLLVLVLVVQAIPELHRSRYLEEFLAELLDHDSWLSRMGYAMRLSVQVWPLRRHLPKSSSDRRQLEETTGQEGEQR